MRILRGLLDKVDSTLWVIPGACVGAAVGFSFAAEAADRALGDVGSRWFLFGGGPDGARELFATVATSMLTFTGLVFSVTVLVLQLASNQFSPRALRAFLRDRSSKLALGIFLGTYVYALLGLRLVRAEGEHRQLFVPALSAWLTVPLVLVSVAAFVVYLHHVAQSIRAVIVIRRIGEETRRALERLYPEGLGADEGLESEARLPEGAPSLRIDSGGRFGTVVEVDEARLLKLAQEAEVTLAMRARVGEFVPAGAPLFDVWGAAARLEVEAVRRCVELGTERTLVQDSAYGFRQLVDLAGRALSPAMNDSTTAVEVLDQLHDLLRRLARRRFPQPGRLSGGALKLVLPRPDWGDYVRLALDEIQVWGKDSLQVRGRLGVLLEDLLQIAPPARHAPLLRQRQMLEAR